MADDRVHEPVEQYRITKAQARRFADALAELGKQERPAHVTPRLWQAQRDAAASQLQDLEEQIAAYEQLHIGRSSRCSAMKPQSMKVPASPASGRLLRRSD